MEGTLLIRRGWHIIKKKIVIESLPGVGQHAVNLEVMFLRYPFYL